MQTKENGTRMLPCLLFVALLSLMALRSMAQIHYVDILPDTLIGKGGEYDLDLDGDALADFRLSVSDTSTYQSDIITRIHDSCFVAYFMVDMCYMVLALELNEPVAALNFNFKIPPIHYRLYFLGMDYCIHTGWFNGKTDKYVGLKVIRSGAEYYGWLRIDVASDGTWVKLKDYASGGSGILTGQTVSGMDPGSRIDPRLIVCNRESEITISPRRDVVLTHAVMVNSILQSRELLVRDNRIQIGKSELPAGLYLVRVTTSDGVCSVKMLIDR